MATSSQNTSWISPEQASKCIKEGDGEGVRIAILDSGVETSHPRLNGIELEDDLHISDDGLKIQVSEGDGTDVYGHATAVADIIHQIAPKAKLGSFRVLNARLGSRSPIIREGVRQAIDLGYDILNCSFGCRGEERFVMQYKDWVDEAYLKGIHIVSACNNVNFLTPEWPGHFATSVSVNMARTKDEFLYYRPGTLIEFAAMGDDIEVAWMNGGKKNVTGSSYAAPRGAAWLARLLSKTGKISPLVAKAALQQIANPWMDDIRGKNA